MLLAVGTTLFVGLLAWQGFDAVWATLMVAGWGLLAVAAFHLVPLVIDAHAIDVLLPRASRSLRTAMLARWSGESVNSLLPAGQFGGPVVMVRQLARYGLRMRDASAAITVSTTMQTLAQIVFALLGIGLFAAYADKGIPVGWRTPLFVTTLVLLLLVAVFCVLQRRGLFAWAIRVLSRAFPKRDWSSLRARASSVDEEIRAIYAERGTAVPSFVWSLVGWIVGAGEVWLALHFLGHPVDWLDALFLEAAGQAIRGAAFAIPGSLGVQEGGYLLLAPLVGLPPDAALALSLVKRTRELALGIPGLIHLQWSERTWRRTHPVVAE